jgi:hypothetical protein
MELCRLRIPLSAVVVGVSRNLHQFTVIAIRICFALCQVSARPVLDLGKLPQCEEIDTYANQVNSRTARAVRDLRRVNVSSSIDSASDETLDIMIP